MKILNVNCDGLVNKVTLIQELINKHQPLLVCLQETKSINIDYANFEGYNTLHRSPYDPDSDTSAVCHGIALIYKDNLNIEIVSPLTKPPTLSSEVYNRFLAINLVDYDVVVGNLYLPSVRSTSLGESNNERMDECLSYITSTLEESTNIILAGDYNYDCYRDSDTVRCALIESHIGNYNQIDRKFLDLKADLPFTHLSYQHENSRRYLDRILTTLDSCLVTDYEILHSDNIGSDHIPILANFDVKKLSGPGLSANNEVKLNWNKAKPEHITAYRRSVTRALRGAANVPKDNNFMNFLIHTLTSCANNHIPRIKHKKKNSVTPALWIDMVKPAQDAFKFWSSLMSITSREAPNYSTILLKRRIARTRFKWAVRQFNHQYRIEKANSYGTQSVFQGLKGKGMTLKSPPKSIEGRSPDLQPKLWFDHYKSTYKAENYPARLPNDLMSGADIEFNFEEIRSITKKLDVKKSYRRHFHWLHAPNIAIQYLLDTLNSWVASLTKNQGNWDFLMATISPIPKSATKPLSIIKSWRPIALASSECYILEKLCLKRALPYLSTLDNQMGYKASHSTCHAIQISKLLTGLDDVHVALLDASSAFDLISHQRIKDELNRRKIPTGIIRIIVGLTIYSYFKIKWFDTLSEDVLFPRRGVKQGGCISAYLFAAAYDILIDDLNQSSAGVYFGDLFVNHLVYADDIILFCKSNEGLKYLYDKVMSFTNLHGDISMNPSKSVILRVGTKSNKRKPVSFCGIPTEGYSKYLGAYICSKKYLGMETSRCRRSLYGRYNGMLRHQKHVRYLSDVNKKTIISGIGAPYAMETLDSLPSGIRAPHRIMTQCLWPSSRRIRDANGFTTRSRTLYAFAGIPSLIERHRLQRNRFILSARRSKNKLIKTLIGELDTISEVNIIPPWLRAIRL